MGLTSAMLVGATGLHSNQFMIDTIGDNIANVNTTAFKSHRSLFETMFYRTLHPGSEPAENFGGTNPRQIGYGSGLGSLQQSFAQGSLQPTGVKSDLAIDGSGFFILTQPDDSQVYARDGAFELDQNNTLVSADGWSVKGYAADSDGTIIDGTLTDLTIPLGTRREAVATTEVTMDGNLDASSAEASTAAVLTSATLVTAGGNPATETTALTDLVDDLQVPLFATGDEVRIDGWEKGGVGLPTVEFVVGTDVTTLGDLASLIETRAGINTDSETGGAPGVTVVDGSLVVTSNLGQANAVSMNASSIRNNTSGTLPFAFTATPAVGEGDTTSRLVYDSLGNPVEVRLRVALESKSSSETVWRFHAESVDDTDVSPIVGTGTVTFDQNGQFVSAANTNIQIDRADTGAVTPIDITLDFSKMTGLATPGQGSTLLMSSDNGSPAGEMIDYAIDQSGIITGTYSNAQTEVLGQVALATFTNPEGLIAEGDNTFVTGINSGDALIGTAQTLGMGAVKSGNLEMSNVELTREFIGLITASTGFSAAGRVVRTADDLLQELLLLAR
ncbi:MAG: flagellar hook-basal body complex protein [Phycisphaerae bacterium]|nr:flagellar hook-basal body complex protein [Phycisphaerae bacterium]